MSPTAKQTMLSSSDAFHFPKLTSANYEEWSTCMKSALQVKYLWLVTDGCEPCPPEPSATAPPGDAETWRRDKEEYLDWQLRDQAAQGMMKNAAEPSQWPHVHGCKTAKELWDTWKKIHVTDNQKVNVHCYLKELFTLKYIETTAMVDHVARVLDLRNRIIASGLDLDSSVVAHALILSLPESPSWELVKIQLFGLEKVTVDIVSTRLRAEANRRAHEKSGTETALHAKKAKKGKGKAKGKDTSGPQPDDVCRGCKQTGHWANRCPL